MNGVAQQPVFLIFEGGGAKGIAHLGALRAVEELGYPIAGVAGASAGAFVAALAAGGYQSIELLTDSSKSSNLLSRKDLDPIGLMGAKSWNEMVRGLKTARRLYYGAFLGGIIGALIAAPRSVFALRRLVKKQGQFSTVEVRDFVNGCLRERLADLYGNQALNVANVPEHVTFGDLDPGQFPELRPLKIIATDIDAGEGVLFDRATTPDVLVGDAVGASIAIPGVFEPARVRYRNPAKPSELIERSGRFADGGLVSNLPSWVFIEERLALQRASQHSQLSPLLAFALVDADVAAINGAGAHSSFFDTIGKALRSGIFGSQAVAGRLLLDLEVIKIPTKLKVLSFDAGWNAIRDDYLAGRNYAKSQLQQCLKIRPQFIRDALRRALEAIKAEVDQLRRGSGQQPVDHMRACRIEPFGLKSLRVSHGVNMDSDADDRLPLDREARLGAAQAMRSRDLQLLQVGSNQPVLSPMTKYERAWLRRDLRTALCIPIFPDPDIWLQRVDQRPEPLGVLSIDSDEDLAVEFGHKAVQMVAATHSVLMSVTFGSES